MSIKIGDRVRFLNSTGGGVVRSFRDRNIVLVEEDDGFETPVLVTDVVVVEPTNQYNFVTTPRPDRSAETKQPEARQPEPEPYTPAAAETEEGEQLSVYLAFVPSDVRHLDEATFDLYIVNDSNYYISFALASAGEQMTLLYADTVEPATKLLLGTIEPDSLNLYASLRFQAHAYKQHAYSFKPAIDSPIRLTLTRFMKLHAFVENDFFDSVALLEPVVRDDFSVADLLAGPARAEKPRPARRQPGRPNAQPELLEVDLHINALVDNTTGLGPKEMLDLQTSRFDAVMRENLRNKGRKIVFIHGKGNGVLRAELYRRLKFYYAKCDVQDANFQKYGFGATMVIIH